MADMARREILPAIEGYVGELAATAKNKEKAFSGVSVEYEKVTAEKLSALSYEIMTKTEELEKELIALKSADGVIKESYEIRDKLLPLMAELRAAADMAETLTSAKYWPFPTYGDLLFGVK